MYVFWAGVVCLRRRERTEDKRRGDDELGFDDEKKRTASSAFIRI